MNRKMIFVLIVFYFVVTISANASGSVGKIDEMNFYYSYGLHKKVINSLKNFDIKGLTREKQKKALLSLERLGDSYVKSGRIDDAELIYQKISANSEGYWQVYNKLEKIRRTRGSFFFGFKNFIFQMVGLGKNTDSIFMLTGLVFSSFFFSSIFVFFLLAFFFFYKYFVLFANDSFNLPNGDFSYKKTIVFSFLLLWPLIFFSGWMIYPFLISGLFWAYLKRSERRSVYIIVIMVFVLSVFFNVKTFIKNNGNSENYKLVKAVSEGKYFTKNEYSKFDNELKVYLAFSHYENGDYNPALDLLLDTGESYGSNLKYNILGNIYYKSGNIDESMKYFKKSLDLDDNDPTALYNFSIVLAELKNPKIFNSYAVRFPRIKKIIKEVGNLKEIEIKKGLLARRILNPSTDRFSITSFLLFLLERFIKMPVIYFSLLMLLYIYITKKIFSRIGESIRCSKCEKIIKESNTDASNNFCSECYQLFMIKDVIFLEPKIAKEETIRKRNSIRGIFIGLLSFVFPGLNLVFKNKYISFILLSFFYYGVIAFTFFGRSAFNKVYSLYPILFNFTFLLAAFLYLLTNLYSVKGDSDGF